MKLAASQKVHYDSGPNMTPLVDIVMVILIFLMLTGTFAVGEHFLQSAIPISEKGAGNVAAPPGYEPDVRVNIKVDSYQRGGEDAWAAAVEGLMIQSHVKGTEAAKAALTLKLEDVHRKLNAANTPTGKIQVIIDPAKTTKYKHLVAVYEAALLAKFEKVAFSTSH